MYLKTLEIRGFKSFAEKTEFNFNKGVIAIVGPNGSGKSNVSDAVRWVLGEQSIKSLRGGKMEDVIFAGTQYRKPVGLAQVSLTLNNEDKMLPVDYSDVTISRRLYRSGESEYFINNTQCRLKDVHELFMDTGIGKEGYSIIGQGKIDAILSGRPEDRRSLLEEASGVVKFKFRKEEAEKKLENTEENLIRINDILSTYEERTEPLKIEKEKAKKYIALSQEYNEKGINILINSIDRINLNMENIKNKITDLENNSKSIIEKKENHKNKMEQYNVSINEYEKMSENKRNEFYKSKSAHQELVSQCKNITDKLQNFSTYSEKNRLEIEEITNDEIRIANENDKILQEIDKCKHNKNELLDQIKQVQNQIDNLTKNINNGEYVIKSLKEDQINFINELSDIKNSINILKTGEDSLLSRLNQIKLSCDSYLSSISINETTENMLKNELCTISKDIENLNTIIKRNKNEISKNNTTLKNEENNYKGLSFELNKLNANEQMLVSLEKNYEGYNKAIKTITHEIESGKLNYAKNKCYILGDVIKVSKEYETAVEIALGTAISDVITEDENIAKELIEFLKKNNGGRATFLPLSTINSKNAIVSERVKKIHGYVGVCNELISYDKKFDNAIRFVIGRTLIADNMNSALAIGKEINYSLKIVTLSGEVVNAGGSLTGGSMFHKNASILGRKNEIENIIKKISETNETMKSSCEIIEKYKGLIKALDEENMNMVDKIHVKNIEIAKLNEKISAIEKDTTKLKNNIDISNSEIESINNNLQTNQLKLTEKQKNINVIKQQEEQNNLLISEKESGLANENGKLEEAKNELTELKVKQASLDEVLTNKIATIDKLSEEIKVISYKKDIAEKEKNNIISETEQCNNILKENEQKIKELTILIDEMDNKFKTDEINITKIKDAKKKLENEYEEINDFLSKNESEKHKNNIICTKYETELNSLYEKLQEEFSTTYAEGVKYRTQIANIESFKKEALEIKNSIAALGTVNVGAVKEYDELIEKYTFMKNQKDDLTRAKIELNSVISELTSNIKKIFKNNFEKLKILFNETFIELFNGGSADLILGEGDELNSSIEINVQPPGKKLQNINLMSGGEKVLSAIALLFAILKMKPTPFCILDEIEAALDDANVDRYAKFLSAFSSKVQFIVITHRKGTMEASDIMYGVTMEEKGISKIVSVDLR